MAMRYWQRSRDGNPYDAIRGMWEGAYVCQFVRLFQSKFGFIRLSIQDLEEALLDNSCVLIADVIARLLRYLTGRKNIVIGNFEKYIQELVKEKKAEVGHFHSNNWQDLGPEDKLGVLKWLVDHVYEEKEEDLAEYLDDNFSPEDLRGICAGQDAFNNAYWYLDDLRLYRENSPKKTTKKDWECVCFTLADWQSFIKQFRKTTNTQERELYTYLNYHLLPIIECQLQDLNDKEKQLILFNNNSILKREQEEVEEMLEKINCLNSNNSTGSVVDTNGTDILCCENSQPVSRNSSNSIDKNNQEFVAKSEDQKLNVNCCAIESVDKSQSDKNTTSAMLDIKPNPINNICTNPCGNTCANNCGNSHDACNCGSANCSNTPNANTPNRENMQDGNLQINDNPSENSLSNKENAPPSAGGSGLGDLPPVSAMSNMVGSTGPSGPSSSVQPLPSNMLNKSTVPMETQYMQQQSQIFVFSTTLANRAAETVLTGQFPSIISFHCSQPGTKRFLEKHPLKVQQFNRQNPAVWLNSLAQMKQGNRQMKSGAMSQFGGPNILNHPFSGSATSGPCLGPCTVHGMGSCPGPGQSVNWPAINNIGPSETCNPQQWSQQYSQGSNMINSHPRFHNSLGVPTGDNVTMRPMGPNPHHHSNALGCMPSMAPNQGNASFPSGNPYQTSVGNSGVNPSALMSASGSLTGVKIPDENLTPQQRQHREEQLAMIRKMQQLLFPDQHHEPQQQAAAGMIPTMHGMLSQPGQPRFQVTEMCPQPGMDMPFPHHSCLNEHEHGHICTDNTMFSSPGMNIGPQHQNMPPNSITAQLEWQKLQHQFYEERRRKHFGNHNTTVPVSGSPSSQSAVNSPSPSVGMSPNTRMPGPPPPPPYHQTPCSTMSSPHPASPNPSSLSLSSPRMASGLPSPADASRQFSHPTPPGPRMPQPSPGNSAGCGSIQTTPLNSPKPTASSSGPPSTGNTVMVRTPTTPSNPNTTPTSTPSSILPSPSPGTPVGNCGVGTRKQSVTLTDGQDSSNDFTPISQPSSTSSSNTGDGIFGRHLSCGQAAPSQKTVTDCPSTQNNLSQKEPSLMPVPSPQQIQYLNTFDGQELTIQKQPNTSLRDLDLVSPNVITNNSMDMSPSSHPQPFPTPDSSQGSFSNLNGPFSSGMDGTQDNIPTQFTGPGHGNTIDGGPQRFSLPSPQMSTGFENGHRLGMSNTHPMEMTVQRFPDSRNHSFSGLPRMLASNQIHSSVIDGPGQRCIGPPTHGPRCGPLQMPTSMENSLRFPSGTSPIESMHRFRGHSPHSTTIEMMNPRIPTPHIGGNNGMPTHPQYGAVIPCGDPGHGISCGPGQPIVPAGTCFGPENSHSHLQSLQKMAPPFDIVPTSKISDVIGPVPGGNGQPYTGNTIVPGLHSSQQTNNSQRLTHFDPIASMAAMSETTGPITTASNTHPSQGMMNTTMNLSNMQVTNATANNQPNMVNFHTNMQSMQGIHQQEGQPSFNIANQMAHNMGTGPQTVNNTYVNATMSIQQLNIQNVTTSAYNPNIHIPPMNPSPDMMPQQMNPGSGAQTVSSSVTTNHPIMHSTVSPKSASVNMGMGSMRTNSHAQSFSNQSIAGQRTMNPMAASMGPIMMTRAPNAAAAFNSTNIHVKANAPNTIQYLPARPQNASAPPNRPATLDFLQRFATPLTNLDNKVPTHNLQYFPNGGNNTQTANNMSASLPPTPPSGIVPGQPIMGGQRSINMGVGTMGMRSPAPGTLQQGINQMYPGMIKVGGRESPIFGRPTGQPGLTGSIMGIGAQGPGMYPSKQMSPAGLAPDASQPLPPSMGHSFNYKQSPFCGPTTADPNYAVQFHNFQQQLYATNTRGNSQNNMNTGQTFFGPK